MKKAFLNFMLNNVKYKYPNYDDIKLAEIRYGLETFYLNITKFIIIFVLAVTLGILKEMLIFLVLYNLLRLTGFGLHATKSWICLLSSSIIFLGVPILCMSIVVPSYLLLMIAALCTILIVIYAPSDTKKRPLINSKKRAVYKIITTLTALIYCIIIIFLDNTYWLNAITIAMALETFTILPISYKIFNLSYNNYKTYKQGGLQLNSV